MYCTSADVLLLVTKTSKTTANITSIIVETDLWVDDWEATYGVTLSSANREFISARRAAIIIAAGEPESVGSGDYGSQTREKQIAQWEADIREKLYTRKGHA